MTGIESHQWCPIDDLPRNWETLKDPQTEGLVAVWQDQKAHMEERGALNYFLDRLKRQWAIETGAIEEIYRISTGATKTLIEQGLHAALLSHEDVDDAPSVVLEKINDQFTAVEGLYNFVAGDRLLSKHYLLQLHQVITTHQDTYDGRDTLGNPVRPLLSHGKWKQMPNNVEGPNGFRYEFCPPEQVESEIERLLELHAIHVADGVPANIEAAWLHHRFVQIHPFTDGNGRMARCLATIVLLKEHWLPLVVTREEKMAYFAALREADAGQLGDLVALFGRLQAKVIREALSLGNIALRERSQYVGVLASIRAKFEGRTADILAKKTAVLETGDILQSSIFSRLEKAANEISEFIALGGGDFKAYASDGPRNSGKEHYNYHQTIQCAKKLGYFANLHAYRAWASLTIQMDVRTEILFSVHAQGRGDTGIIACVGMTYSRRTDEAGETVIGEISPLSESPFEFTYGENRENVVRRFTDWLEACVTRGLARWGAELG